jgi:hypothetical protein
VQRCGWEKYFHNFVYRADVVPRLMCGRQLHKETYFHVAKIVSDWSHIAKTMWKEWRHGNNAVDGRTSTPPLVVEGSSTVEGSERTAVKHEEQQSEESHRAEVDSVVKEIEAAIRAPAQDEPLPPEAEEEAPTPVAAVTAPQSATAQVAGHIWSRVAEYWHSSSVAAPSEPQTSSGQKRSRTASGSSIGTSLSIPGGTPNREEHSEAAASVVAEPIYDGAEQYRELLNGAKLPFDFFGNFHFLFRPTRGAYAHSSCPGAVYYSLKYFEGWSNVQLEDHSLDRYCRALALLPIVKVGPKPHTPEDD